MTDATTPRTESGSLPGVSGEWISLLELNPDALLVIDRQGMVVFANPAAEELFGIERSLILGASLTDGSIRLGALAGGVFDAVTHTLLAYAREGCEPQTLDLTLHRPGGRERVLSCAVAELSDTGGGDRGLIAAIRDVSESHRLSAHERVVAEAGRILVSSLDAEAALAGVAQATVPSLADGCGFHLAGPGDGLRRVASAGLDGTDSAIAIEDVLATGEPYALQRTSAEGGSLVVLPLTARSHTIGVMELRFACDVEPADIEIAERLAHVVALAVDNDRLRQSALSAQAAAAAHDERAASILESISDAFWAVDEDDRITYVNHRAERVLGKDRDDMIGVPIGDLLRQSFGDRVRAEMAASRATGARRRVEVEAPGGETWLEVHVFPAGDGLSVYLHDIGARRRAAEAQRLLIDTGTALTASLDSDETLRLAARVAVPTLADFCTVDLIGAHDTIQRVAAAGREAAMEDRLLRLGRRYPPDPRLPSAIMRAVRTGETIVANGLDRGAAYTEVPDPELLRLAEELGATAALIVPLKARGRRLGVITFAFARSGRHYTPEMCRLAEDVSRRAAIAIDNARLYEEVQESSRAKSNFISVMSHEFRTPLTAIVGYADLLNAEVAGPLTETQQVQLGRIKQSAWHLTQLIEEVLTFSRVEAGRETLTREVVDLTEVAAKAAALIEPVAHEKRLRLQVDLPSHPLLAHTDSAKISQILINLLSNAVKFTLVGEVRLKVWRDEGRFLFRIEDTGIGIAAHDRLRIFESFWQVEQGTTRTTGGTGLGLTITRRLAHLLGGDIEVTSEVGVGSAFTAWLPVSDHSIASASPPRSP